MQDRVGACTLTRVVSPGGERPMAPKLAFRFWHPLGLGSTPILDSQFGTIKKRNGCGVGAATSELWEFSSDLSEIISAWATGSLQIQAASHHSG